MINIAIVDDHVIVRNGLSELLKDDSDIVVHELYGDGQQFIDALPLPIDIVLLDVRMKQVDGLTVLQHLTQNNIPIKALMLTFFAEASLMHQCKHMGAKGFLNKDCDLDDLVLAIKKVYYGNTFFTHDTSIKHEEIFTERELSIILCLAEDLTNEEIASRLHLSLGTIKNYHSAIYSKLEVKQRPQALSKLKKMGFI